MAGQTTRENIEQEVQYLLEQLWGTAWGEEDLKTYQAIVDWAVGHAEVDDGCCPSCDDRAVIGPEKTP